MTRLALVLLYASTTAGCLPFAAPPLRVRAGIGPTAHAETVADEGRQPVATQVSAAVHPLQLTRKTAESPVDFGVGYQFEVVQPENAPERSAHGAIGELGWYPVRFSANGTTGRLGPFLTTEALVPRDQIDAPIGYGGSLGAALELTGYAEGGFSEDTDDGSVFGFAAGQWALGMYASGAVRNVGGERYWTATFGVSGRIPLLVGVACCYLPEISSGGSSSSSSSPSYASEPARERRKTERRRVEREPASPSVRRERIRARPSVKQD